MTSVLLGTHEPSVPVLLGLLSQRSQSRALEQSIETRTLSQSQPTLSARRHSLHLAQIWHVLLSSTFFIVPIVACTLLLVREGDVLSFESGSDHGVLHRTRMLAPVPAGRRHLPATDVQLKSFRQGESERDLFLQNVQIKVQICS